RKSAQGAAPETHPALDAAAGHAVRYYKDFVKPAKVYRAADAREAAALAALAGRLRGWTGGADAGALQDLVYELGKDAGFEPLRAWFGAIYEVLLGANQGPRFGGFIALYGVEETADLIDSALAGALHQNADQSATESS
ncbi:MAG: lysine--tRNA ligase, partial [Paracoccaceae bacterium]